MTNDAPNKVDNTTTRLPRIGAMKRCGAWGPAAAFDLDELLELDEPEVAVPELLELDVLFEDEGVPAPWLPDPEKPGPDPAPLVKYFWAGAGMAGRSSFPTAQLGGSDAGQPLAPPVLL